MKQKLITKAFIFLLPFVFLGCKKNQVEQPGFDVKINGTMFKVGEDIPFTFTGNPDFLTFYSGEIGNDYEYLSGRNIDIKSFSLFFQSRVTGGTQPNQFSIHISSDFNGQYDIASIRAATWKDITSLFVLATDAYLNSGKVDLSSVVTDKTKPLYFGFKYIVKPQTANGTARAWTINALVFETETDLGIETAMDQKTGGWVLIEDGEIIDPGRSSISASSGAFSFRGNTGALSKNMPTESWVISKDINLSTVDLGPDKSLPVKGISENIPADFTYKYTKPGTYKAVFSASNSTVYGQKAITKELNITIQP
jgi:hypothetical protein